MLLTAFVSDYLRPAAARSIEHGRDVKRLPIAFGQITGAGIGSGVLCGDGTLYGQSSETRMAYEANPHVSP